MRKLQKDVFFSRLYIDDSSNILLSHKNEFSQLTFNSKMANLARNELEIFYRNERIYIYMLKVRSYRLIVVMNMKQVEIGIEEWLN